MLLLFKNHTLAVILVEELIEVAIVCVVYEALEGSLLLLVVASDQVQNGGMVHILTDLTLLLGICGPLDGDVVLLISWRSVHILLVSLPLGVKCFVSRRVSIKVREDGIINRLGH